GQGWGEYNARRTGAQPTGAAQGVAYQGRVAKGGVGFGRVRRRRAGELGGREWVDGRSHRGRTVRERVRPPGGLGPAVRVRVVGHHRGRGDVGPVAVDRLVHLLAVDGDVL